MRVPDDRAVARVGVIAGGGNLPFTVLDACREAGLEAFVAGLEGSVEAARYGAFLAPERCIIVKPEKIARIFSFFKKNNVSDLMVIGKIARPSVMSLRPDWAALSILVRHLNIYRKGGDDALLRALRAELERRGFYLHAVQDVVPDVLAGRGTIGTRGVEPHFYASVLTGWQAAKDHGDRDLGQSVCVKDGVVIGLEGADGTDALIAQCDGDGRALLVKTSKPQQDMSLDVPTIGPQTIEALHKNGFAGCVIEAGKTLVHDREEVARLADLYGIFVVALDESGLARMRHGG